MQDALPLLAHVHRARRAGTARAVTCCAPGQVERGRQGVAGIGEEARLVLAPALGIDLGGGADPPHHPAVAVEAGRRPAEVPAVRSVGGPADAVEDLEGSPLGERPLELGAHRRRVVGVHRRHRIPEVRRIEAGVLEPAGIAVLQPPGGIGRPHHLGHRLGQRLVARLAVPALRLQGVLAQQGGLERDLLAGLEEGDEHRGLRAEHHRVEGLHQVVHRPLGIAPELAAGVVGVGGEKDDRRRLAGAAGFHEAGGLEPVHPRHLHVEDDQGELLPLDRGQGLRARRGTDQPRAEPLQDRLQGEEVVGVVVDEEDARPRGGWGDGQSHGRSISQLGSLRGRHCWAEGTGVAASPTWRAP
jgi:hypothetical protein